MPRSVGDWYTASYSNHIARLHRTPFMPATGDTMATVTARDRVQVLDAATGMPMTSRQIAQATDATNQTGPSAQGAAGNKNKGQTLFGPDVGFEQEDAAGGWTPAVGTPSVPLAVVKTWMERAKADPDPVHKTTTLQAMVNLKRPSLSLIALTEESPVAESSTTHALGFTYDASSPAVQITLTLHPRAYPLLHPSRPTTTLYSAPHPGGFGKHWQLPPAHAIDLARMIEDELEVKRNAERAREEEEERRRTSAAEGEEEEEEDDLKKGKRHSGRRQSHSVPAVAPAPATPATPAPAAPRRLGIFARRQRRQDEEQGIVAGIRSSQGGDVIEMQPTANAANANADPHAGTPAEDKDKEKNVMEEDGIRVLIRLEALDEQGNPIVPANAQLTHVLLTGTPMTSVDPAPAEDAGITPLETPAADHETPAAAATHTPVKRVWALKVVRREAVIARHTFLLKEIYGLSASAANDEAPAPAAADTPDLYGSTPNECIVCLTNARDVVLLPCRHLVVCRECALGMIEFGAGGKVARREEVTVPTATGDASAPGATDGGAADPPTAPAPAPAPAPTTRERRKRKAKGWFCPVCRQPYTSLLRLALPAPIDQATDSVEIQETADDPAADTATIRSFRTTRSVGTAAAHSLHRVSSRATLPERGERMLRDLAPDDDDDDDEEDEHEAHRPVMREQEPQVNAYTSSYPPRPAESEGERRERLQQEEMDREQAREPAPFVLGDEVDVHTPPAAHTLPNAQDAGRQSVEGTGWRAVA